MRPRQAILALEDLANSLQGSCYRDRKELSSYDRDTVVDVYSHWVCLLLDLGYLTQLDFYSTSRRLLADLLSKDVLIVNGVFAELLQSIRLQNRKGFKGLCSQVSTHLYNIVKADFVLVLAGDYVAAKRLVQLFSYTGRLTLTDINLQEQCLTDYLSVESSIIEEFPEDLVQRVKLNITRWMKPFDPSRIRPHHSNGAVADVPRASLELKYRSLGSDQLVEYAYGEPYWLHGDGAPFIRRSLTTFVPKSYKTFRTISMEPSTLMYLQQGVWDEIDRVACSNPFLRRHIGFHDQVRNQRLALQGSHKRNYATIDLSSASDSVSYALVKKLFRSTKLLRYLVATRSTETLLPNGDVLKLRKFAPSGSALCFPVETLIFASVCQCATVEHGVPGDFSCFGDDLVVPTQCAGTVVSMLTQLGFKVNTTKTYSHSDCWFRESCGVECCDGYDVTPLRVSRKYAHRLKRERVVSLVKLANEAYVRGFVYLRAFMLRKMQKLCDKILFGETSVLSDESTNFHLMSRWHPGLQRLECKAVMLRTEYEKTGDDVRYRHWLESTVERKSPSLDSSGCYRPLIPDENDTFISRVGRPTVKLRSTWVPKPYHHSDDVVLARWCPGWRKEAP